MTIKRLSGFEARIECTLAAKIVALLMLIAYVNFLGQIILLYFVC